MMRYRTTVLLAFLLVPLVPSVSLANGPYVDGDSCSALGLTVKSTGQSALLACMLVSSNNTASDCSSGCVWKSMTPVPTGGIMAFNATSCPSGWSPFNAAAGRTIVGAGQGVGLTIRNVGDTGGEETHQLTTEELPSHTHQLFSAEHSEGTNAVSSDNYASYNGFCNGCNERYVIVGVNSLPSIGVSGATGSNQAHNVMQPFVSLLYCQKN